MIFLFLLLLPFFCFADLGCEIKDALIEEGITVDLANPTYCEGMLKTSEGGIISAKTIRIQAREICYTQTEEERSVIGEGQLIVTYAGYTFVGKRVEFDLQTGSGILYEGRSSFEPWHFGGRIIYLHPNESIEIIDGYFTTSEHCNPDWAIQTKQIYLKCNHDLIARNVTFRVFQIPVFYAPKMQTNLDTIFDSPVRYRARYSEEQGLLLGMSYELFDWQKIKGIFRFDYRLNRGPGAGFETHYESKVKKHWFHTVSYIANDSSIEEPKEKLRYRLEGVYHDEWQCGRTSVDLSYDYLSDRDMATDFEDNGLNLETAERTQLNIRRQEDESFITNFFTRVRINNFQTLKQELPSIGALFKPTRICNTGVIMDNQMKGGYFDFKYSEEEKQKEYYAWRWQYFGRLYRPIHTGPLTFTPEAGVVTILYGSSPELGVKWLNETHVGGEMHASIYRTYNWMKHVIEPYGEYCYLNTPTISPNQHFIFDITDGWYNINSLRMGFRNLFYRKASNQVISPYLLFDLYTFAFTHTNTIPKTIPKAYLNVEWNPTFFTRHVLASAWDFERNNLLHWNWRSEITLSETIAFTFEYRSRTAYDWRKAVYHNFILDAFRTEQELRNSLVSDRRDTFLLHLFCRMDPFWATEITLRNGWNRIDEPHFTEYEIDLLFFLRASWNLRVSFQQLTDDRRLTFYFNLGGEKPKYQGRTGRSRR